MMRVTDQLTTTTPEIVGSTVISALSDRPPEQLEAVVQLHIITKLFAMAGPPSLFGGGDAPAPQPFPGFGAAPSFLDASRRG